MVDTGRYSKLGAGTGASQVHFVPKDHLFLGLEHEIAI